MNTKTQLRIVFFAVLLTLITNVSTALLLSYADQERDLISLDRQERLEQGMLTLFRNQRALGEMCSAGISI